MGERWHERDLGHGVTVAAEELGTDGDGADAIVVRVDGVEVGAYAIAMGTDEVEHMTKMLRAVMLASQRELRADVERSTENERFARRGEGRAIAERNEAIHQQRIATAEVERLRARVERSDAEMLAAAETLAQAESVVDAQRSALADAYQWVREMHEEHPTVDHACARCVPGGALTVGGFVCVPHRARGAETSAGPAARRLGTIKAYDQTRGVAAVLMDSGATVMLHAAAYYSRRLPEIGARVAVAMGTRPGWAGCASEVAAHASQRDTSTT